jgi:hypothetical protein
VREPLPYLLSEAPECDDPPDVRLDAPLERGAADGLAEWLELGDLMLCELWWRLDGALTLGELRGTDRDRIPELEREGELGREGLETLGTWRLPELDVDGRRMVVGERPTGLD